MHISSAIDHSISYLQLNLVTSTCERGHWKMEVRYIYIYKYCVPCIVVLLGRKSLVNENGDI